MKKLIIATRKSALALWQSEFIKFKISAKFGIEVELKKMKTKGDVILDAPLAKIGGKGLFTKELENSMLQNEAHIAVHSLKDVPMEFPNGLILGAISKREDARDAFVSENFTSFDKLPKNARIGTTSLRRQMQILNMRPDLRIIPLRGNVNTRFEKLKNGYFDAIILAVAGIKRLGLDKNIKNIVPFSLSEMIPAMGQGALGIEARNESEILEMIEFLNDEKSFIETKIERDFIRKLNGGCQVPIGINASFVDKNSIKVMGIMGLPNGNEILSDTQTISKGDFATFGEKFANKFIKKGALDLLKRAEIMAENLQRENIC